MPVGALLLGAGAGRLDGRRRGDGTATRDAVRDAAASRARDVNAAQGDGMTALHWAAMNGDVELAQMLLYAGANVKATTRSAATRRCILAAQQRQRGRGRGAARRPAPMPKRPTATGTTPLMLAARVGQRRRGDTRCSTRGADVERAGDGRRARRR